MVLNITNHKGNAIPVRTAFIKNTSDNKSWQACGDKATLAHCWKNNYEKYCSHYGKSMEVQEIKN